MQEPNLASTLSQHLSITKIKKTAMAGSPLRRPRNLRRRASITCPYQSQAFGIWPGFMGHYFRVRDSRVSVKPRLSWCLLALSDLALSWRGWPCLPYFLCFSSSLPSYSFIFLSFSFFFFSFSLFFSSSSFFYFVFFILFFYFCLFSFSNLEMCAVCVCLSICLPLFLSHKYLPYLIMYKPSIKQLQNHKRND